MIAVANSSVLIALSSIGRLALLNERFPDGVLIPPAVWDEVVVEGGDRVGAREVAGAKWIRVVPVTQQHLLSLLSESLDSGEAEAIALGVQQQSDVVLFDEREARRAASRVGLSVLGTVGLLVGAKRSGGIARLADELDRLSSVGFRLGNAIRDRVLRET